MKNYYAEIDSALKEHEMNRPYVIHSIDWICGRIDWVWKWRKVTEKEMNDLANRACRILEGNMGYDEFDDRDGGYVWREEP